MTVYLLLAGFVLSAATGLGGFVYGVGVGNDKAVAAQAKVEEVANKAAEATANKAVDAIAAIEVTNKTIYNKATHEVRTNTVFADCVNTDSMHNLIVEALRGPQKTGGKAGMPEPGRDTGKGLRIGGPEADRSGGPVLQVPGGGAR